MQKFNTSGAFAPDVFLYTKENIYDYFGYGDISIDMNNKFVKKYKKEIDEIISNIIEYENTLRKFELEKQGIIEYHDAEMQYKINQKQALESKLAKR
jgi:hypothetical protein